MPLHILIILVVVGIAGVTLLTRALGLARPRRFDTDDEARAAFLREFPETEVFAVTRCHDGSAALLRTTSGPALVWPMGIDSTARLLREPSVVTRPNGLEVRLHDFTAPVVRLRLDSDEASEWRAALKGQT